MPLLATGLGTSALGAGQIGSQIGDPSLQQLIADFLKKKQAAGGLGQDALGALTLGQAGAALGSQGAPGGGIAGQNLGGRLGPLLGAGIGALTGTGPLGAGVGSLIGGGIGNVADLVTGLFSKKKRTPRL